MWPVGEDGGGGGELGAAGRVGAAGDIMIHVLSKNL